LTRNNIKTDKENKNSNTVLMFLTYIAVQLHKVEKKRSNYERLLTQITQLINRSEK